MEDELHEIREKYYVGAFGSALEQIGKTKPRNDLSAQEKASLEARTYLASGKYSQLKDLRDSPEAGLKCTACFAMFLKAKDAAQKKKAFDMLNELAKSSKSPAAVYLAAAASAHMGNIQDAIEITNLMGSSAEMLALRTQLYLQLNRGDLASKQLREVNAISDDHSISKLVGAFVNLALGNAHEAFLLYTDLEALHGDSINNSSIILNGKAASMLERGMYEECEEELKRIYDTAPNDADTLVNMIAYSINKGAADEEYLKYVEKLKVVSPDHTIVKKLQSMEVSFANFVA